MEESAENVPSTIDRLAREEDYQIEYVAALTGASRALVRDLIAEHGLSRDRLIEEVRQRFEK